MAGAPLPPPSIASAAHLPRPACNLGLSTEVDGQSSMEARCSTSAAARTKRLPGTRRTTTAAAP